MYRFARVVLSVVAVLAVASAARADTILLTNGNFETTGTKYNDALEGLYEASGWTNLSGLNIQACSMLGGKEYLPAATDGSRVLRLVSDGTTAANIGRIAQDLGTMAAGEKYTFTADALGGKGYGGLSWGATAAFVNQATDAPSVVYASQTVDGVALGVAQVGAFNFSYTATAADAGNHLFIWLEAKHLSGTKDSIRGGIDHAQLTVTLVPEPCSLVLLCAGMIGMLAYAWRKRK